MEIEEHITRCSICEAPLTHCVGMLGNKEDFICIYCKNKRLKSKKIIKDIEKIMDITEDDFEYISTNFGDKLSNNDYEKLLLHIGIMISYRKYNIIEYYEKM